MAKVKRVDRDGVKLTNQLFVRLREIGCCDGTGRPVAGVCFHERMMRAEPDQPLVSLVYPLVVEMTKFCHYSTDEAMQADIEEFQKLVSSLRPKEPDQRPPLEVE